VTVAGWEACWVAAAGKEMVGTEGLVMEGWEAGMRRQARLPHRAGCALH